MPEHLSDLLHRSVDDTDIPRPAAHEIWARGRTMRTRRRVGVAATVAVVVGAIGVGGYAVSGDGDADSRIADRTDPVVAAKDYADRGTYTVGNDITVGAATVTLPGEPVYVAQTSIGAVVQIGSDEVDLPDAPARSTYVLVAPDGTQRELSLPATVEHVEGDLSHPRVAWIEAADDAVVVRVWDVEADQELGSVRAPSPGTKGGVATSYVRVALLDGDFVHFSDDRVNDAVSYRGNWTTGERAALSYDPYSVPGGVGIGLDGDAWVVHDARTDREIRRLRSGFGGAMVSPDGRWLLAHGVVDQDPAFFVEPIAGGKQVPLPDIDGAFAWTPGGNVMSTNGVDDDGAPQSGVVECTVIGACTVHDSPADVRIADYLDGA